MELFIGVRVKSEMEEVCRENGVHFLDMPLLDKGEFDDGLHPNARGHKKIFLHVRDFLIEQHWI